VLGGLAGILAAGLGLRAFESIVPSGLLPYRNITLSQEVVILMLALAAACGLGVSLWPASRVARGGVGNLLQDLHRSSTEGKPIKLSRQMLVAAQIGCAVLAVVLFSSLLGAYRKIGTAQLGFDPGPVLIANLRLPQNAGSGERWKALGDSLVSEVTVASGVAGAAISVSPPLTRSIRTSYAVSGKTAPGASNIADYRIAGPDYFAVLGIPILKGRSFLATDTFKTRHICVVNETLARAALIPGREIGAVITPSAAEPCEVIGVAGDVASYNLRDRPAPAMYVPFDQMPGENLQGFMSIVVRTSAGASQSYQISQLTETIRRAAPSLPARIEPVSGIVAERTSPERFRTLLMGTVGVVALVLAASGIYATVSNFVVRQRRNVTIRLALGATTGRVIGEVLRNTLVLAAIGLLVGATAAYPLLKALSGILSGAGGLEISRVATSSLLIAPVAALSAYMPARRILRFHVADVLKDV
jgi:hypothetical protein